MNPFVSPQWIFNQLYQQKVRDFVIFDTSLSPVGRKPAVDVKTEYLAQHIANAVFFDIDKMSDQKTDLPHMLLSEKEFSAALSALEVNQDSDIIIYERAGVFSAPRVWWMLRTFGVKNIFILDGGLRAWIEQGFPTESGSTHSRTGNFKASLDISAVKNYSEIQNMIIEGKQILDARSAGRFNGTMPEPRVGISSGHMPGSINIPYGELLTDDRLKSAEDLRKLFAEKGVDLNQPITTSCGSGVTAAVLALGLEIAGAQQVSLYDGSWAEYAQQPEAVIVKIND